MPEKTEQKIKIGRKSYAVKPFNKMNRAEARFLRESAERSSKDPDALWDMLAAVVPSAPQEEIDTLSVDEAEQKLRDAKIITGRLASEIDDVMLGESAASTDS